MGIVATTVQAVATDLLLTHAPKLILVGVAVIGLHALRWLYIYLYTWMRGQAPNTKVHDKIFEEAFTHGLAKHKKK